MGAWDVYQDRINVRGVTKRDTIKRREIKQLQKKIPDSLSYQSVKVFDGDYGFNINSMETITETPLQNVAIINSDNLDAKYICSLPGEDIHAGALIGWMDTYWLVSERDANTTLYTRAKMIQCNYLLRWVSDDNRICEQWCMIEDGTKLEHAMACNGLVYRKRYAKRIPLIAGTPLELYSLQHGFEIKTSATV